MNRPLLSPSDPALERPKHGGDIHTFCAEYGFRPEECLDLSTGISPWAWHVPEMPAKIWAKLPSSTDYESRLLRSASEYYQCDPNYLLPVAGSQAAIESLPHVAPKNAHIALPAIGYEEHRFAWLNAGRRIYEYRDFSELRCLIKTTDIDHAVVINPNNPTTAVTHSRDLDWLQTVLTKRGGFLILDEAFADPYPQISQIPSIGCGGLIILRSIGKFFGLAGLRLGFAITCPAMRSKLAPHIGLWSVNNAALWMGEKLLADTPWINTQTQRVKTQSASLLSIVRSQVPHLHWQSSALFVTGVGSHTQVSETVDQLAALGVYSRQFIFDDGNSLIRLGLPNEFDLKHLTNALTSIDQSDN